MAGPSTTIKNLGCSFCTNFSSEIDSEIDVSCQVQGLGEQNASLAVVSTSLPLGEFDCTALDADGFETMGVGNILGARSAVFCVHFPDTSSNQAEATCRPSFVYIQFAVEELLRVTKCS